MTPKSFHINKVKVLSTNDGLAATEFGNIPAGNPSVELEIQEVLLEDLSDEEMREILPGVPLYLNFDNYAIDLHLDKVAARKLGESHYETFLSSKEPVEAEVVEILEKTEGSLLLKIIAIKEFDA